jgi:hypothetical protein
VVPLVFVARLPIVIPKNLLEMGVEVLGGTSVFTSGLPVYANEPEAVPVPLRLITALPPVEELLVTVS